jgi:hypothetical protein
MESTMSNLIPYSVYLSPEHYAKIREHARNRKASSLVRDAITMIIDGNDPYKAGYHQAIRDAAKVVDDCKELKPFSFNGKNLCETLFNQINRLETSSGGKNAKKT